MFHEAIIAIASLLLIFSSGHKNYRRLLYENKTIPKDIKNIEEQLKEEPQMNPLTRAEFDKLLARTESFIPNFDQDQLKLQSKRIENIKKIYEMNKKYNILGVEQDNVTERSILRQGNIKSPSKKATERAMALMTQFVYAARNKLQYGQFLRKEYKYKIEYKIGYCFALMRELRKQQMFLYTTMYYNLAVSVDANDAPKGWLSYYSYSDFTSFLQMYEKIVRLNVDMLDIVRLVQKLINRRMSALKAEQVKKEKDKKEKDKKEKDEKEKDKKAKDTKVDDAAG